MRLNKIEYREQDAHVFATLQSDDGTELYVPRVGDLIKFGERTYVVQSVTWDLFKYSVVVVILQD